MDLRIRPAEAKDLAAINEIYNHYVTHSTATFQIEPETAEARQRWFAARAPEHPVVVLEEASEVVGWGALSTYRERAAYARTVENSLYVRHDRQRRGYGSMMMLDLIERGRALGHHTIIAVIDARQPGSIAMHARLGFVEIGRMREVGYKFERWLDVVFMQAIL